MKERIVKFFESQGYSFDDDGNIMIEYIDSIEFINLIISLEEFFDFSLPDEYLLTEYFQNIDSIVGIIEMIGEQNYDEGLDS